TTRDAAVACVEVVRRIEDPPRIGAAEQRDQLLAPRRELRQPAVRRVRDQRRQPGGVRARRRLGPVTHAEPAALNLLVVALVAAAKNALSPLVFLLRQEA